MTKVKETPIEEGKKEEEREEMPCQKCYKKIQKRIKLSTENVSKEKKRKTE